MTPYFKLALGLLAWLLLGIVMLMTAGCGKNGYNPEKDNYIKPQFTETNDFTCVTFRGKMECMPKCKR